MFRDSSFRQYASARCNDEDRQGQERLYRHITPPALGCERLQCNDFESPAQATAFVMIKSAACQITGGTAMAMSQEERQFLSGQIAEKFAWCIKGSRYWSFIFN